MNEPAPSPTTCPLSWPEQRRNLILFALSIGIGNYLAAPALYVGVMHAGLCERLGADKATSNLPATLFFAMTAMPAFFAWASPGVSTLKRNLTLCYLACAVILTAVAASLLMELPNAVKVGMIILQGGVVGAVMPAATAYLWEAVGRGTDDSRRWLAMLMAFGGGPLLAVIGSFSQSALVGGPFLFWEFSGLKYPWGYVVLFGMGVPMLFLAIFLGRALVIPPPVEEPRREPVAQVRGLLAGLPLMMLTIFCLFLAGLPPQVWEKLGISSDMIVFQSVVLRTVGYSCGVLATLAFIYHYRSILSQRLVLIATIVTLLVYCGNMIPSNMNLYSQEALGDAPALSGGQQNALRFAFKFVAGLCYGVLLAKTNPRFGILTTSFVFLLAPIWAIFATGTPYYIAFGIYGAGELVGAYAPSYLVSASRKEDLRKTTAFMTMLMAPAAPVGYLYGSIVDLSIKSEWTALGMNSEAFGFRLSFALCAFFIFSGIVLALIALPKWPRAE